MRLFHQPRYSWCVYGDSAEYNFFPLVIVYGLGLGSCVEALQNNTVEHYKRKRNAKNTAHS